MPDIRKKAKKDLNSLTSEFMQLLDLDDEDFIESIVLNPTINSKYLTKFKAAIYRYTTYNDAYRSNADNIIQQYNKAVEKGASVDYSSDFVFKLFGVMIALKNDLNKGHLNNITELVHADSILDIKQMANDLNDKGYVDAAAIIIGTGLELHLKNLCSKYGISLLKSNGKNKEASMLNTELYSSDYISKGDHKDIISWQDVRNNPAHGNYGKYTKEKIDLVIQGIILFIKQNPA